MKATVMEITCYLSSACGSEEALKSNIAFALDAEDIEANVQIQRTDGEKVHVLGLSGSPSVFINGKELQPTGNMGFS